MAEQKRYWLIKSEPDTFSIEDLKRDKKAPWDGVRNYQARNFMRDEMQVGDLCLFYHSSANPPGIAGIAKVASKAYPDFTQFERKSPYFDPKSTQEEPRWFLVDMAFVKKFKELIPLNALKADPKLDGMLVRKPGVRLSIQPVSEKHFRYIAERLAR